MKDQARDLAITPKDHLNNIIRAAVKIVPWIGGGLDQLLYGGADKMRWKRIERTLEELGQYMEEHDIPQEAILHEDFEALLRRISMPLGSATNEDKRTRFRDLLLNAATIPPGDAAWESARLAAELLEQVEGPGLAILAAVAAEGIFDDSANGIAVLRYPQPQVYLNPIRNTADFNQEKVYRQLNYEWAVVEAWLTRLYELKLITGHLEQSKAWTGLQLTSRGSFLVKWTLADKEHFPNIGSRA